MRLCKSWPPETVFALLKKIPNERHPRIVASTLHGILAPSSRPFSTFHEQDVSSKNISIL